MSYLDLSDRRVEFTAVLDPRERRKSIVGRRVATAKEKKKREEREERGREYNSGEKEESGRKNGEIRGCVTGSIMKSLWAYLKLL